MNTFNVFLLIIINIILVNSQIYSEDCVKVYNFYNVPLDHNCCLDAIIDCDNEGYITTWNIAGNLDKDKYDFYIYPNLPRIKSLSVTEKGLETVPEGLLLSSSLESLILNDNNIKFLPNNFFQRLPNLKTLCMSNNYLEDLPSFNNELNNLEYLALNSNKFKTLPENLYNLPNLKTISINNNSELSVAFNRSPSQNTIKDCYLVNLNILCYEPGSCEKIYINDENNFISNDEAKTRFKSCMNNNINNITNNSTDTNKNNEIKPNSNIIIIALIIIDVIIYERHNVNEIIKNINTNNNNNNNNNININNNINNNNNNNIYNNINNSDININNPYSDISTMVNASQINSNYDSKSPILNPPVMTSNNNGHSVKSIYNNNNNNNNNTINEPPPYCP
ncbi:L domain-like protein [Anaeromyces robustus]|uniref:L domain-like protein n=1 Tax=Anaeromyces robustus TaxID=1754192 RepID=A0A1Y1WTA2_9FUNG|nr:L domain-like protein [Anaeromyces robustus]|eukprot:ORX76625.1 L domain-like protein [Anaeromyces robustus]